MDFDKLQLMRGEPYLLFKDIMVKHPTLNEIIDYGYVEYSMAVDNFVMTAEDIADILWVENKIMYTDIESNWQFFIQRAFAGGIDIDTVEVVDGQQVQTKNRIADSYIERLLNYFFDKTGHYCFIIKTQELEPTDTEKDSKPKESKPDEIEDDKDEEKKITSEIFLLNISEDGRVSEDGFKLTEPLYHLFSQYLKTINWHSDIPFFMQELHSKNKAGSIKLTSKKLIKAMLEAAYAKRNSKRKSKLTFDSIISALICYLGDFQSVWDLPIYMVYDLYHRLNKFKSYDETMAIVHSGYYDIKKNPIKWDEINWASVITI